MIRAAVVEFAEHGYTAASTTAIARRVGISQPYVYALFSTKRALFLAAHECSLATVRAALVSSLRGGEEST